MWKQYKHIAAIAAQIICFTQWVERFFNNDEDLKRLMRYNSNYLINFTEGHIKVFSYLVIS